MGEGKPNLLSIKIQLTRLRTLGITGAGRHANATPTGGKRHYAALIQSLKEREKKRKGETNQQKVF